MGEGLVKLIMWMLVYLDVGWAGGEVVIAHDQFLPGLPTASDKCWGEAWV